MGKRQRACEYTECIAETLSNSKIYLGQLIILVIGLACLIKSPANFNFITLGLYVAPILLNDGTGLIKLERLKLLRNITHIIKGLNIFIIVFCILGFIGFIEDRGEVFATGNDVILLKNIIVSKSNVALLLIINIIYTFIMFMVPARKGDSKTLSLYKEVEEEMIKGGSQ